tara:strand:- start:2890 stop:3276 length:387 start_codon:yes stop_codon:yes gene_type:complete
MINKRKSIKKLFVFSLFIIIFFSGFIKLSAEEINWQEVAKTNDGIQFIDVNSIKYNNRGFLSVITKYDETNPDDQVIINSNSYLMAVDCDNRLFSKLPLNGELNQVKNWEEPTNDKLTKNTIINSCSY